MAQDPNVSVWRSAISINWVCWNCPIEFCRWDACMKSHAFKKVSVTQQAPKSHLLNWNCFNMAGRKELGSEYTESFEPVTCQSQYCASETNLLWRFRQKLPHQNLLKANKSTWWEWGKALNIRLPSALLLSKGAKPWLGLTPSAKRRTSLDINRLQLIAWSWTFIASSPLNGQGPRTEDPALTLILTSDVLQTMGHFHQPMDPQERTFLWNPCPAHLAHVTCMGLLKLWSAWSVSSVGKRQWLNEMQGVKDVGNTELLATKMGLNQGTGPNLTYLRV